MSATHSSTAIRSQHRVVVVGNGMVGHRFCEELADRNSDGRFKITCIGEEPRPAYDRVHLSDFFSGKTAKELQLADAAWYAERGIELHLGERVARIDREERCVRTDADRCVGYDTLVL